MDLNHTAVIGISNSNIIMQLTNYRFRGNRFHEENFL